MHTKMIFKCSKVFLPVKWCLTYERIFGQEFMVLGLWVLLGLPLIFIGHFSNIFFQLKKQLFNLNVRNLWINQMLWNGWEWVRLREESRQWHQVWIYFLDFYHFFIFYKICSGKYYQVWSLFPSYNRSIIRSIIRIQTKKSVQRLSLTLFCV